MASAIVALAADQARAQSPAWAPGAPARLVAAPAVSGLRLVRAYDGRPEVSSLIPRTPGVRIMQTGSTPAAPVSKPRPSRTRRIVWGAVGAVGGFFGGIYLGEAIDRAINPDCGCDDPGLVGAVTGAFVGPVVGAVVLARLAP